jgi:hypothetical protein
LYVALIAGIAAWIMTGLRGKAVGQALFALLLWLVVADPFLALFLPTLYTEAPGAIGLMVCLGALLLTGDRINARRAAVFALGMALLGSARQANLMLPLMLVTVLALSVPRVDRRSKAMMMLVAAGTMLLVAQLWLARGQGGVNTAQRTNAVLMTLAPQASDAADFLRAVGLPDHCLAAVGGSHFTALQVHPAELCPEIADVGAFSVLVAAARHPTAVMKALRLSNLVAGDWRFPYVAQSAGSDGEKSRARDLKPFSGWSFADAMPWLTPGVRWLLFVTPVIAGLATLLQALARRKQLLPAQSLLVATGGVIGGMLLVNLLGDGLGEPARHAHLAILVLPIAWGAIIFVALDRQWAIVAAASAGAAAALAMHVASPIAHGFPHQKGEMLVGWAASTEGVSEVRVLLQERALDATVTLDPGVDGYFGFPVGSTRAWQLPVPRPPACAPLRIEARSGPGAEWLPVLQLTAHPDGVVRYAFGCESER